MCLVIILSLGMLNFSSDRTSFRLLWIHCMLGDESALTVLSEGMDRKEEERKQE